LLSKRPEIGVFFDTYGILGRGGVKELMQISLTWEDPATGERRSPVLNTPIAIGREFAQLPSKIAERRVSRIQLDDGQVSRFHVLLDEEKGLLVATDSQSSNGIEINGSKQLQGYLQAGDRLGIGGYTLTIIEIGSASNSSKILFNPVTNVPDPYLTKPGGDGQQNAFLPQIFQQQQVSIDGLKVETAEYGTVGGGFGSFAWVDLLRIAGVPATNIAVLSPEKSVYGRYRQLCLNAHVSDSFACAKGDRERLRSQSDACPDNIWGFPSYGLREALRKLGRGQFMPGLQILWQLLAEPLLENSYSPVDEQVLQAVDREAARIGWQKMLRYAMVQTIRQTTDGRYALLYSQGDSYAILIARYLHLATGYPAVEFLPDLQAYRQRSKDFQLVVNAYEPHDHIYERLGNNGGTVLLRGAGTIACRVLQRIYRVRRNHPQQQIKVIHLWSAATEIDRAIGVAQRPVNLNYQIQAFEWPKACWGGEYKMRLATATAEQQQQFFFDWEGATIPQRRDWQKMLVGGISKGWYRQAIGQVELVTPQPPGLSVKLQGETTPISADYIIDATGLAGAVMDSQLLADLVQQYQIRLNPRGQFMVGDDFAIDQLNSGSTGRVYAAGITTSGNGYGPVDSFLGLQYAALAAVCDMTDRGASDLKRLTGLQSIAQWWRWMTHRPPD
jgi:pSer/pThr/pTyr-binding forkhead associated (FHA) protein